MEIWKKMWVGVFSEHSVLRNAHANTAWDWIYTVILGLSVHANAIEQLHVDWLSMLTQYTVWVKKIPLRFSDIFSQTGGNFLISFCTPITRFFLH